MLSTRSIDAVIADDNSDHWAVCDRTIYCAPHYLGVDVVAANNLDDQLPGNNKLRGRRWPRKYLSQHQIPPGTSAHRCADNDRLGEFQNIEATASGH